MSEYIITKEQIEELNRAYGGMKIVTSWLSCYAIWDTSNIYPVMKSEHVAVDLPEIVRCRDCKHFCEDRRDTSIGWVDVFVCVSEQWSTSSLMPNHKVEPDGFCAWGERRDA